MQTGSCWHFHAGPDGRMGDFYTGYTSTDAVSVADAVAASSAFTPGFGPLRLRIKDPRQFTRIDPWGEYRVSSEKRPDLANSYKRVAILTDGGVYDNLGVEPIWNRFSTVLISDAGHPFASLAGPKQYLISRLKRAIEISIEQVGAVRKRWFVQELRSGRRSGALWAINSRLQDFPIKDAHGYSDEIRDLLSRVRTDLNAFSEGEMACLENHGYSIADAAIRSYAPASWLSLNAPFVAPHERWFREPEASSALASSARRTWLRNSLAYIIAGGS
jgi:NTE family protein